MTPPSPGRASATPTPPRVLQPYLRALASALGGGGMDPGRPTAAALRSLVRGAKEALESVTPVAKPMSAPSAKSADRPGLALTRQALKRLAAAARSAGLGSLADLYPTPTALAEDVFLVRCLQRDPAATLEVAAMRDLLSRAAAPERLSDLTMDRALGLEQTSFTTLWAEPQRLDSMRATFDYFRRRRQAAVLGHHRDYWRAMRRVRLSLEDCRRTVDALVRLNSLDHLGRPLGEESLAQYDRLLAAVRDCPLVEQLEESLGTADSCPACGLTLADQPPSAEVDAVLQRLIRALSQQITRLSSETVRSTLGRARGRRIEQFVQAAEASDQAAVTSILDDDLLEFLRDLLGGEPTAVSPPVLDRLRRAYPAVGEDDVEAATAEFRRLLEQALSQQRRARPGRPPVVRLDPPGRAGAAESPQTRDAGRRNP